MKTETPNRLTVNERISIPFSEIEFSAVRASGPGGQHVNKTNSAVELRFAIAQSSLPEAVKSKLFAVTDRRLNAAGVIVIKSQNFKSQKLNRDEACKRLVEIITKATQKRKYRVKTKPTRSSVKKRLDSKSKRSAIKSSRGKVRGGDE